MSRELLLASIGSSAAIGIGYYIITNKMSILENLNYYYREGMDYIYYFKPIRIYETIQLDSKKIYLICLMDKDFIVTDLNIDIEKYKILANSIKIPHTPNDILEANIITDKGTVQDITDICELLIGPFLN